MKLCEISSIKVYPQAKFGRDNHIIEVLSAQFDRKATVTIEVGDQSFRFEGCEIDMYTPYCKESPEVYDVRKDSKE